ncbi:MAG: YHYH protein [Rhodoferax sp.]|nr:YHYH protein [Rhodoferax sp.]MCF8210394.1 YHYH protein [Rhodoferax sp.]
MRRTGGLFALVLIALAGCSEFGNLPWAPSVTTARPGNASAIIAFEAPVYSGQSAISTYVASCTAAGETWSARGEASPLTVLGLGNGVEYACVVSTSNAAGTGANSIAVKVTPRPDAANSLASGYRQAAWATGMSITFPNECTMTVWPSARPSHAVDGYYLTPVLTGKRPGPDKVNSITKVSAMPLEVTPLQGLGATSPIQFNICPSKAPVPTAVNAGAIGVLISGSVLFGAAEITGHRATTLKDNASYTFKSREGATTTARFVDQCNGHPTPVNAGNSYHYHGLSECVTSMVDQVNGPSHLIGVALDGFPIYGDKDMNGQTIAPARLDACNGITSPTPEFPQGVYHYVLPSGVKEHNASMRCYSGDISRKELAIADSSGFCYAPQASGPTNSTGRMEMGEIAKKGSGG